MKKSAIIGKRTILLAVLVIALGAAVYFNWHISKKTASTGVVNSSTGSNLGDAVLVNTTTDDVAKDSPQSAYFKDIKSERETARKKSVDAYNEVINNPKSDSSAVMEANAGVVKIADNAEKENSIETLVKGKGFKDCAAVINGETVSVMVACDKLLQSDTVQIQEIASNATGFTLENIKIIEVKNS